MASPSGDINSTMIRIVYSSKVKATLEQPSAGRQTARGTRPVDRSASELILVMSISAMETEDVINTWNMTPHNCEVHQRAAVCGGPKCICSSCKQFLHAFQLTMLGCLHECSAPTLVLGVHRYTLFH
jgi:orotidine-5'-phosphate decarboxylase